MVDSKEIEELRALVFASIPAVARKGTGISSFRGQRRCTSLDTEEGEILSDEDAAAAMAAASATINSANTRCCSSSHEVLNRKDSEMHLGYQNNNGDSSTKQGVMTPVSKDLPSAIITESPSLVAFVSSQNQTVVSEDICKQGSEKASEVWNSKNEAVTPQLALKTDSLAKSELSRLNQRIQRPNNGSRVFKSAPGSFTSRISSTSLPSGGLSKEADAFLASLSIPAMASSSHLSSFPVEKHNSLVIKFSDDDSDSEGEQDAHASKEMASSKKLISGEAQASASSLTSRMGHVTQTTTGLISEIDRVKKQIAAIERARGSSLAPRASKTASVEVGRQLPLKSGVPTILTTSGGLRMPPIDLKYLRQQIAAKESELKRRKQKGVKEFVENGIAPSSVWAVETLDESDAPLFPMEKPDSGAGLADVYAENISESPGNEMFNNISELSMKDKLIVSDDLNFEQENSSLNGVLSIMPLKGTMSTSAVAESFNAQFSDNSTEQVSNKTSQPGPGNVAKHVDMAGTQASFIQKRKWQDTDSVSESVKRTKTEGAVSSAEVTLLMDAWQGASDCHRGHLIDGNTSALIDVSGGVQSSQGKESSMPFQGMSKSLTASKSGFVKDQSKDIEQMTSSGMDCANEIISVDERNKSNAVVVETSCAEDVAANGAVDEMSQLDGLSLDAGQINELGTIVNATCSAHVSTLMTPLEPVENLENFDLESREQNMYQATSIEAKSNFPRLPVLDWCNAKGNLLQDLFDHRLEHPCNSQWKLREEEDAADKELEEAQQHRRRCEVREHLLRRQYRDAEEALHAANLRCEMLFQKREMLSASVKAKQLQMSSTKSTLRQYHGKGSLISVGKPGKDCFMLETSFRGKNTVTKADVNFNFTGDLDLEGPCSDLRNGPSQPRISPRSPQDGTLIEDTEQSRVNHEDGMLNDEGREEALAINSTAKDFVEVPESQCDILMHGHKSKAPEDKNVSLQNISAIPSAKVGSLGDCFASSGFAARINEKDTLALNDDGHQTMSDGDGKNSHGFSSASFATELWIDGNQVHLSSEEKCLESGKNINLCFSDRNIDSTSVYSLNVRPTMMNETTSCMSKAVEQENGAEWAFYTDKITESSQERPHHLFEPFGVEKTAGTKKQGWMFFGRTDNPYFTQADNSTQPSSAKDAGIEPSQVQAAYEVTAICDGEHVTVSNDMSPNRPKKHKEIPSFDHDKEPKPLVKNFETESDTLTGLQKSEQTTSLNNVVTSTGFNLLFNHAPNSHSADIWKQLINPDKGEKFVFHMPEEFESPSHRHRCCGGVLQSMDSRGSLYRADRLDPHKVLCVFEHRGKCNNDECPAQHKRDYMQSLSQKNSREVLEVSNCSEGLELSEQEDPRTRFNDKVGTKVNKSMPYPDSMQTSLGWNWQPIKAPIYNVGKHFAKVQSSEALVSGMVSKQHLRSGMPFSGLHREASMELPCLFDSSLKLPSLIDGSKVSRQLRIKENFWTQDEGHDFDALGDGESLLETALELFDYDIKVEKSELQKSVLYVLSRGLEANPGFAALWVVYLHLYYRWEKGGYTDDLFASAVEHNDGSYELWMMFINSRDHLKERLEAYEIAMVALGSRGDIQGHAYDTKSSLLLDLALQKLNCLCIADSSQEALSWIKELCSSASEAGNVSEKPKATSTSTLLTCLTRPDLCILWICCAYVMLQHQLPDSVVESLGCKQKLFFDRIWPYNIDASSCASQVMNMMRTAASSRKGCMKLEMNEPEEKNVRAAKEFFAINFVQCAAVCEGLHSSLILAEHYFRMFPPSVELTLIRVRLEQQSSGKMESLGFFEEALCRWPLDQTGKMGLWNQYIECMFDAKGADSAKKLLDRCAGEICDSDIFQFVGENDGTVQKSSKQPKVAEQKGVSMSLEDSDTSLLQSACQFLPRIVKTQQMKDYGFSSQLYSLQDAVFAYVNLAFLETLNKNYKSARSALQSGLNVAVDAESIQYGLKEIAAFTYRGLDNSNSRSPMIRCKNMLALVDRCIVESQLIGAVSPLSRQFCETLKRRRVSHFVSSLICPSPTNSHFLNLVLETIHGPTLLPGEEYSLADLVEVAEKLLEISPGNVRLATSICRIVKTKLSDSGSKSESAILYWCSMLLIDSLCQTYPEAPEPRWVEAGNFLKLLEVESLLEEFYRVALLVYPFSTSLWHGLLDVCRRKGNAESVVISAKDKGVKLESMS